MNKKGISDVITTLVLVALILITIGVIWIVINNIIDTASGNIENRTLKIFEKNSWESITGAVWVEEGKNIFCEGSKVGIGTATPSDELEVVGNVEANGFTINGVPLGTSSDTYWSEEDGDIYYNSGNIGISTKNPLAKLDVDGSVRILI